MPLQLLSVNYKNAPVQMRERLALPHASLGQVLQEASHASHCAEVLGLSTCNRVEFYLPSEASLQGLSRWLETRFLEGQPGNWHQSVVTLRAEDALRHLFRVACSLESMVVGEAQILGQLKQAHQQAKQHGMIGPSLEPLLQGAYRTAKRVRSHTNISRHPVSISHVAVQLAVQIFDDLSRHQALVVGAGEMAELAARCLQREGIGQTWICNRTFSKAAALAQTLGAGVQPFEQLPQALAKVDVVIGSTHAKHAIITKPMVLQAMNQRRGRPLLLIDIALPHDVDPKVADVGDVYCYNLDDLHATAAHNQQQRQQATVLASQMVEEEIQRCVQRLRSQQVQPLVCALRQAFGEQAEIQRQAALKALQGLPAPLQKRVEKALHGITHRLVNQLLHTPLTELKRAAAHNASDLGEKQRILRELFGLKEGTDASQPAVQGGARQV